MQKKSFFSAIFLIFLSIASATAETFNKNAPSGTELSIKLSEELKKNGFFTVEQELSATGSDIFPFNVLVSMPATTLPESNENISNLIIAFTQEDAFEHLEKIIGFIQNLKKLEKQCSIEILFSASDMGLSVTNPRFLNSESADENLNGTKIFSKNLDDSFSQVALALKFSETEISKSIAYPGSSGDSSPSFLVKMLFSAFSDCGEKISIQGASLSLYRLKILSAEKRMQSFMEEGIPAISVMLSDEDKLSCIEKFVENFKTVESDGWDRHYSFFLNGRIFLSERFFVLFFLVVLAITLFLIFAFSFVGANRFSSRRDFFKTIYIFPATVLLSFLALIFAQAICVSLPFLKDASLVAIWTIKIAIAVIFVTVVFVFQERFFGKVDADVYGYITTLAAVLNIIIFSAIDLSFLFVFLAVYIVMYFSRTSKMPVSLIVYFFLSLVPFLPYANILWLLASEENLRPLVICNPLKNFILAIAIFPHLMIYLRIFHVLKILRPELVLKKRQIVARGSISILIFLVVLALLVTVIFFVTKSNFLKSDNEISTFFGFDTKETSERVEFFEKPRESLSVTLKERKTVALNSQILTVSTKKRALKISVKVFGTERSPVYNSDYEFELDEKEKSATFLIPDNPPENFTINFISSEDFSVEVKAYFLDPVSPDIHIETFRSGEQ